MKKLLAIVLALALVLSLGSAAWASEIEKVLDSLDIADTVDTFQSPTNTVTSDDLPATTEEAPVTVTAGEPAAEEGAPAEEDAPAEEGAPAVASSDTEVVIVENKDFTEEQKAAADAAIAEVVKENATPVATVAVQANGPAKVTVTVEDDDEAETNYVVYVFYPDGKVVKFYVKDLFKIGVDTYELPVDGNCTIVVATEG